MSVFASNQAPLRVGFRVFWGTFSAWNSLFTEAAQFASTPGRDRLISISHSAESMDGVVTVWFWDQS